MPDRSRNQKREFAMGGVTRGVLRALLVGCALFGLAAQADAQTFVEHSAEVRMQLDFVVPDAALRKFLPAGWEPNVATQGAAKDCNLRMIFIDRVDITKQDGSPADPGSNQLVYLAIPIKQPSTNTLGQMLIFGLTADAKDAPGAHGVYVHANTHRMARSTAGGGGKPAITEEHWEFAAASGERLEVSLKYERAAARKSAQETKFFSSTNPGFHQVFKIEQGLDIMRNSTITVRDRVSEFSYKASGGKIAPLFDGTERVVSIDALHWYNRGVYLP
jgi:hypothetical protein